MKKDRMKYLLCKMIYIIREMYKSKYIYNTYNSVYDILKENMDDNEMRELGLDIEYLKGC